jgi:hypothetical protein
MTMRLIVIPYLAVPPQGWNAGRRFLMKSCGHSDTMPRHETSKSTIIPRLLTRQQAAAYCGVSVPTFESICPIKAVALGTGKRLERFDRISLDRWINSLTTSQLPNSKDWLAELEHT